MLQEIILIAAGLVAGLISGTVGFGGSLILLPTVTSFYGIEVAVPMATVAQLLSNIFRMGAGFKAIRWRKVWQFLILAAPLTVAGAYGFVVVPKEMMTRILCAVLVIFAILELYQKITLPKSRPVAYIATEAASATIMHIVQMVMYGEFGLLDIKVLLDGIYIGVAMSLGNFFAMKRIQTIKRRNYRKIVAVVMIAASIWLFFSV